MESYEHIQHIFADAGCDGVFYGVLRGFSFSLRVCETGLPKRPPHMGFLVWLQGFWNDVCIDQ